MTIAINDALRDKAAVIVAAAQARGLTIITAESCTGGRLAAALADAPNASQTVHGGFVTYTLAAKIALGVDRAMLKKYGAVSEPVARLMAEAALERSPADIAVSVTGVAGPTTDDDNNPPGLMFVAATRKEKNTQIKRKLFAGLNREAVLFNTIETALSLIGQMIDEPSN
jgi:nicotinamide-nucleotide amidase